MIIGGGINNWRTADILFTWQTTYHFALKQSWSTMYMYFPGCQKISHLKTSTNSRQSSFFITERLFSRNTDKSQQQWKRQMSKRVPFHLTKYRAFCLETLFCLPNGRTANGGLAADNNSQQRCNIIWVGFTRESTYNSHLVLCILLRYVSYVVRDSLEQK